MKEVFHEIISLQDFMKSMVLVVNPNIIQIISYMFFLEQERTIFEERKGHKVESTLFEM